MDKVSVLHDHDQEIHNAACVGQLGICAREIFEMPVEQLVKVIMQDDHAYRVIWGAYKALEVKLAQVDARIQVISVVSRIIENSGAKI